MPIGLLGRKLGQTRVYDSDGNVVPVTVIKAGPNRVLQVKTPETDGYFAVQLAFGDQKPQRLTRPELGHLMKYGGLDKSILGSIKERGPKEPIPAIAMIREFRDFSLEVKPGQLIGPEIFQAGDYVDVIGYTKGRGFQGVVKRFKCRGGDASHGAKGWHRRIGAIGQRSFPGNVKRGQKMPGHMGCVRRTIQNLQVVQVIPEDNLILVKGAVPGAKGDIVIVREAKKRPKGWAQKKAAQQVQAAAFTKLGGAKSVSKGAGTSTKK